VHVATWIEAATSEFAAPKPFQQPERVVGFFNTYRQVYPEPRLPRRGDDGGDRQARLPAHAVAQLRHPFADVLGAHLSVQIGSTAADKIGQSAGSSNWRETWNG
jgi:hypothetical protein